MQKNSPPDPPRKHQGEGVSIRPPLGTPPPPTKGGGLLAPSPWNPPQAVLLKVIGPAPALRSGGRAKRTLPALHSAPGGSFCFRRTTPGCFQRGDVATSPLWSVGGGLGERIETLPQGFLQGAWGTFFGLQRMSPKVFPATAAGNLPHKRMALRNCSAKDWQKQISQYATPQ